MTIQGNVTYDFLYGESYSFHIVSARDLQSLEERAGIYGWYLRLPQRNTETSDIVAYRDISGDKDLIVEARAHLREHYSGRLTRTHIDKVPNQLGTSLHATSALFAAPIYIGVSQNIRQRLQQHKSQLRKVLNARRSLSANVENGPDGGSVESDTDEESRVFAHRIGEMLQRHNVRGVGWLFAKVYYSSDLKRDELEELEYFLNRLVTPVCGRQ